MERTVAHQEANQQMITLSRVLQTIEREQGVRQKLVKLLGFKFRRLQIVREAQRPVFRCVVPLDPNCFLLLIHFIPVKGVDLSTEAKPHVVRQDAYGLQRCEVVLNSIPDLSVVFLVCSVKLLQGLVALPEQIVIFHRLQPLVLPLLHALVVPGVFVILERLQVFASDVFPVIQHLSDLQFLSEGKDDYEQLLFHHCSGFGTCCFVLIGGNRAVSWLDLNRYQSHKAAR